MLGKATSHLRAEQAAICRPRASEEEALRFINCSRIVETQSEV